MGWADTFSFFRGSSSTDTLPNIFPFPYLEKDFVSIDVEALYSKILTDVLERTDGIPEDKQALLWDNCLASEMQDGLVTMLAKAMTDQSELFLVYDPATNVIRKARGQEIEDIRADYLKANKSSKGVFITFKNYRRTTMLKIYSAIEYCTVGALYKMMNLAKAVQLKIKDLRASVSSIDKDDVKAQMLEIANGLKDGKDVGIDVEDAIETAKPDLTSTETSFAMNAQKMARYSNMPASYITGETKNSMGDTGEGDAKKVEQGLKGYYFSIIKPVIKALFEKDTTFKSDDFRMIDRALNILRTMEATSEEFMTVENKLKLVNKAFGFPVDTKGGPPPPEVTPGQQNGPTPPQAR